MIISWNSGGFILLDGVKIKYHPTRSPFAPIAPACGSYRVTAHDDESVTIDHDDPTLSGTHDLDLDPTVREQAIPHVAEIRRVLREMMRLSYLNVRPAARVPVKDAKYLSDADVIAFAKAVYGIVLIDNQEDDE